MDPKIEDFIVRELHMSTTSTALASFPIRYSYTDFLNWSEETQGKHILSCAPASAAELLKVVNWAYQNQFRVRPVGEMHNWSQLTIANGDSNGNVLLVDMKKYLKKMTIAMAGENATCTAQAGILMEDFMTALEKKKLCPLSTPAPGDLTLGGVLAIGGHGTCLPAVNEAPSAYGTFGSLSNAIVSLTAVVWNEATRQYELKTFMRNESEASAFLVHAGRALIFEVTLQVPRNKRLRCQSYTNVPASELFARSAPGVRTFSHFLDQSGRGEIIWFPFTENPWLKIWTVTPSYPLASKRVSAPFNYPFSDRVPKALVDIIKEINTGHPDKTPAMGQLQNELVNIGLGATLGFDLWGWSKDVLLYVRPDTLRVTANGYAIITKRANIQNVLNDFYEKYNEMVADYKSRNSYPMNGPIEVRVTGLDRPSESIVSGAVAPALSAARPVDDRPDWDVAIWLDILTMPGTPDSNQFYQEMEEWIFEHFSGDYAHTRIEWSKGWGYTRAGAWTSEDVINRLLPESLSTSWQDAVTTLNSYDPHNLFYSPLIEKVFSN